MFSDIDVTPVRMSFYEAPLETPEEIQEIRRADRTDSFSETRSSCRNRMWSSAGTFELEKEENSSSCPLEERDCR
jgi:hypothetical protein